MKDQKQIPQNIDLNDILMKMKTLIQFEDFFQKAGKHKYLNKGLYFPDFSHANSDFAFQVLKGDKKVITFKIFYYHKQLLKIGNSGHPKLASYLLTDKLSKTELYAQIRKKEHLNCYLPSASSCDDIPRDYMLSVCFKAFLI